MIGAIARIEQNFGFLWGHDKDPNQPLTPEEEDFADRWEFLRNDILNYGNKQIRQVKEDLHKCGAYFTNKYSYHFPVKKKDDHI